MCLFCMPWLNKCPRKRVKGLLHSWRITFEKDAWQDSYKTHMAFHEETSGALVPPCILLLANGYFSQPVSSIQRVQYASKLLLCLALSWSFQGYKMPILTTFLSGFLLSNNKGTTIPLFLKDVCTVLACLNSSLRLQ